MSILDTAPKNRRFLIIAGVISLIIGFFAVSFPLISSIILEQFVGGVALASGVIALVTAFSAGTEHRLLLGLSAFIRIATGLALICFTLPGVAAITLLIAVVLILEGVWLIISGFRLRGKGAWGWLTFNGIITLALGIMIYAHWPSDSAQIIGILFGINLLFSGGSLLALGSSLPKNTPVA